MECEQQGGSACGEDSISAQYVHTRTSGLVLEDNRRMRQAIASVQSKAREVRAAGDEKEATAFESRVRVLEACLGDRRAECELAIQGMTPPELNAIRRTMLADVRYLGVDVVSISANSSQMYDEVLASRVAHVPLRASRDRLDDDSYRVELTLRTRHDGDSGVVDVMSDSMHVSDPSVSAQGGMRLVRLQPGQSISLTAIARPGTAREHTKWRAAHTAVVLMPEHADLLPGVQPTDVGVRVLKVGTNHQTDALQCVLDAIAELVLRIEFAVQDVSNPTGGSDVDVVDPFDVMGVGYA